MWKTLCAIGLLSTLTICNIGNAVQNGTTVLQHDFEESTGTWTTLGNDASLGHTKDAANVKEGKGALEFKYEVKQGGINFLMLPVHAGQIAKAKAFRFWIKTSAAAPMVFTIAEAEGGRWNAIFSCHADKWQKVELGIEDFELGVGQDQPKDANGKLDLDKVESASLVDIAQLLMQGGEQLLDFLGLKSGAKKMYLDGFQVSEDALAKSTTLKAGEGSFDTYTRPQLAWLLLGNVEVSKVTGEPLTGAGIKFVYKQEQNRVVGMSKFISPGTLTGGKSLHIVAAAKKPTKLVAQLEEGSGGKYNVFFDIPAGGKKTDLEAAYADFVPAEDSKDDNAKLDLDQVKQFTLIDMTGILDQATEENTLWLGIIKSSKTK